MAILQFNGTDVTPEPSDMSVTVQDIASPDSGRNAGGVMHKVVLRQVRTIHLSWNNIGLGDARRIIGYLRRQGTYVTVNYDGDPAEWGTYRTGTFYYGDLSAAFQQCWVGNKARYSKLSFDLIER